MIDVSNYKEVNRKLWNERTKVHVQSEFYDVASFKQGKSTLNSIELDLFGNVSGKSVLHLQCHFGLDSLSLTRLGANVTGVDLSDVAIQEAKSLAVELNLNCNFICCDIYDLVNQLDEKFDFVFTSYGTIGWLPDIQKWSEVVSHFLKPEGEFVFVEFHPFIWMFDNNLEKVEYSYFNRSAIVEVEEGTYGDRSSHISLPSIGWNHAMGEVLNSLITSGLAITNVQEFDYSPYNIFPGMKEIEAGKFVIEKWETKIPLVYSIKCQKSK